MTDILPDDITYGFVADRILRAVGDTTDDPDRFPDGVPGKGTVTFIAARSVIITVDPPARIIKDRIECTIHQGADEPGDPDQAKAGMLIDPAGYAGNVALVTGFYTAKYALVGGSLTEITFEVKATHTNSAPLWLPPLANISPTPTTKFVVNEQVYLDTLAARDDVLAAIPGGGATGQVLAKATAADLDTEWVNQTGGGGSGGAVNSVNAQTGTVVLDASDVGALPASTSLFDGKYTSLSAVPPTFAPIIGTTSTTAMAGDTVIPSTPGEIGAATAAQGGKADTAVQGIQAGSNVTVDNSDPLNPKIASTASGGGGGTVETVNGDTGPDVVLTAADVGALPTSTPLFDGVYDSLDQIPSTFPPEIGTTATTALAGDTVATDIGGVTGDGITSVTAITQTAYDALSTPRDAHVLYVVVG